MVKTHDLLAHQQEQGGHWSGGLMPKAEGTAEADVPRATIATAQRPAHALRRFLEPDRRGSQWGAYRAKSYAELKQAAKA